MSNAAFSRAIGRERPFRLLGERADRRVCAALDGGARERVEDSDRDHGHREYRFDGDDESRSILRDQPARSGQTLGRLSVIRAGEQARSSRRLPSAWREEVENGAASSWHRLRPPPPSSFRGQGPRRLDEERDAGQVQGNGPAFRPFPQTDEVLLQLAARREQTLQILNALRPRRRAG